MLLDELMPEYQVAERHQTLVRAAPGDVYAAVRDTDLARGPVTRLLFALRVLPAAVATLVRSPRAALAEWRERRMLRGLRLADFERAGFRIVGERASEELVIGLLGRFWTPRVVCAGRLARVPPLLVRGPAGQRADSTLDASSDPPPGRATREQIGDTVLTGSWCSGGIETDR